MIAALAEPVRQRLADDEFVVNDKYTCFFGHYGVPGSKFNG